MKGQLILKSFIISQRYGLVLPENTPLNFFTDSKGRYFCKHPEAENLCTRVSKRYIQRTLNANILEK